MKKAIKMIVTGALFGLLLIPAKSDAGVRVYVKIGPPRLKTVRVVKPAKLYRHSVWVAGHWQYRNGRHLWVSGYWIKKRPGYVYVQPHWKKTRHGYYFVSGHWVKR